jgi:hypothetical protein
MIVSLLLFLVTEAVVRRVVAVRWRTRAWSTRKSALILSASFALLPWFAIAGGASPPLTVAALLSSAMFVIGFVVSVKVLELLSER